MSLWKLKKSELIAKIERLEIENAELRGFKQGMEFNKKLKDFLTPTPYQPKNPNEWPIVQPFPLDYDRWNPWGTGEITYGPTNICQYCGKLNCSDYHIVCATDNKPPLLQVKDDLIKYT